MINDELAGNEACACAEHLAVMEQSLISLEAGGAEADGAAVNRLLGATRSVLAGAVRCRLAKVRALAERTERALVPISLDRAAPAPEWVTLLLRAVDTLRAMLDDPDAGEGADISEIMRALATLVAARHAGPHRGADWRLRALVVEDDFAGRLVLQTFLSRYGECHVAVNGREAVEAFHSALDGGTGYDLVCMDIMMPEMDGEQAVREIRALEEARGIFSQHSAKIVMTTALNSLSEVSRCFHGLCDAYLVKPIDLARLLEHMQAYGLVGQAREPV
jgi:two-component system chemotaxis response regulator CheY